MDNQFDHVFVKTEPNEFVLEDENVVDALNNSNINKNHEKEENPSLIRTEIYIKSEPEDFSTFENIDFTYCHVDVEESSHRTYETRSKLLDAKNELKDPNVSKEFVTISKKSKRNRKFLDLDTKIRIIRAHENGRRVTTIAREENLNSSTVSTILKEKEKIKDSMMDKNVTNNRKDESRIIDEANSSSFLPTPGLDSPSASIYDQISPQLNKLYSVIHLRDNDKDRCDRVIKKIENIVSCYKKS